MELMNFGTEHKNILLRGVKKFESPKSPNLIHIFLILLCDQIPSLYGKLQKFPATALLQL